MELDNLKKQLDSIGKDIIIELSKQLIEQNKVATGNLLKSLDHQVIETIDGLFLQILSEPYLKNVDEGRKPGIAPPVNAIKRWVRAKNIKFKSVSEDQSAFIISRSIGQKGIVPTHILRNSIDNIFKNRQKILELGVSMDIEKYINKILTS